MDKKSKNLLIVGSTSGMCGAVVIGLAPVVGIGLLVIGTGCCLAGLVTALGKK